MQANQKFLKRPIQFWAEIKLISEKAGYSSKGMISSHDINAILRVYRSEGFKSDHLISDEKVTKYGMDLIEYMKYRAEVLNNQCKKNLMDKESSQVEFEKLYETRFLRNAPLPANKQKGEKAGYAFFTGIINMLIENSIGENNCEYDPKRLTTILKDGRPIQVLSRRVDGAFPSPVDPIAIWEIKEYYYTTTFGSRVADGVYESLLDGMELQNLYEQTGRKVYHYLMVDDFRTWWGMGKSYLCRMVDMMHMGYVDEVLFGREVIDRIPDLAKMWIDELSKR